VISNRLILSTIKNNFENREEEGNKKMGKLSLMKELWDFLKVRKRYWLAPIIIILFLLSVLIVVTESAAVMPFIYTLF
jgi:hypothetical protein